MSTAAPAQTTPSKTTPSANTYDVARPLGKCNVCQRDLSPGEKFMAGLRETAIGFERVDVCPACWENFDRKDVLAFWQAVLPRHEVKKKLFVDDTVLCELFERLADTTEPAKINFRFVLGLILMRKRLLVYENTRVEGSRELWSVRLRGREEMLDLLNPKLDEAQVQEVSQQLSQILSEETQ